jgi:hypothetical protein
MRHVPPVRTWRVRYYLNTILLADLLVQAPTRLFARWAANERVRHVHMDRYLAANRVSISLPKAR